MAEFVDVLRQFDRMCNAHAGCINCPLYQNVYNFDDECHIGAFIRHPEKIEQTVMQWAAEHPEPVYPTWGDWLIEQGVIEQRTKEFCIGPRVNELIPADIAQKLGIEPKEG